MIFLDKPENHYTGIWREKGFHEKPFVRKAKNQKEKMGLFCFRNNVYVRERQANSEAVASDHHQPRNEKDMSFVHLKHLQPWKSRVDNFLTRGNTKEKRNTDGIPKKNG